MELGAVLKKGQDLMRKSHGDDAVLVQEKLAAIEDKYSGKALHYQGLSSLNLSH